MARKSLIAERSEKVNGETCDSEIPSLSCSVRSLSEIKLGGDRWTQGRTGAVQKRERAMEWIISPLHRSLVATTRFEHAIRETAPCIQTESRRIDFRDTLVPCCISLISRKQTCRRSPYLISQPCIPISVPCLVQERLALHIRYAIQDGRGARLRLAAVDAWAGVG